VRRSLGAVGVVLLCGGCFVDAVGVGAGAGGNGDGGSTPSTTATGDVTSQTAATTTSSTAQSTTTGGMGGEGGIGGAPCPDSVLALDDSDFARVQSDDFNLDDDFAVGAWIYTTPDMTFAPGDSIQAISIILSHGAFSGEGFMLGLQETADDGQPYAGFLAYPFGQGCLALAPIAWNAWVHVAGVYNDNIGGDDLFLYVNGALVDGVDCPAPPPVFSHAGPLVIGGLADSTAAFFGAIDDLFVKEGSSLPNIAVPITCDPGYVAAFDFETGMTSSCANALTLVPDASPGDPEIDCMQ
jgi:hypothetical protein